MERWRKILRRWGPRSDLDRDFYPDRVELEQPALLNSMGPMAAAFVAARILRAVVARRGSRIKPSTVEKLEKILARSLPDEARHHCEVEAERILEWIDRSPSLDDLDPGELTGKPDIDVMLGSDLESRLSVARFALDEDYDLELEYFDEESHRWARIRGELHDIVHEDAADFETSLALYFQGTLCEIPFRYIRWLMPVTPKESDESTGGDLLEFPEPDDDR